MFQKILIANRGEIACRILRTARAMGILTVAVYSEADKNALHVELADESVLIGPPPPRQSYLDIDRIVAACRSTGAEAVHPGYGFLSENEAFVRRLEGEGIVFIGPGSDAIAAMGDKIASKRIARQAGVNVIPGSDEEVATGRRAVEIAREIGYPVMLKASAGGGGKGLRIARDEASVVAGFEACRAEAAGAFGDDRIFIEKYIEHPRHIEIQILADSFGDTIHLGERECSLQRRHQKVVEEAPSPFLDEATRRVMGEQAVALAKAVGYRSAGTVEFVVGKDRGFYFLEMNTRLQVEHPVTEMTTGLDLVEQMIRIAAGERLGQSQDQVRRDGWAIECRINAEDPFRNFLPSIGRLVRCQPPDVEAGVIRVDTGVVEGDEISIHYDSMIAKVVTHGWSRREALGRMHHALDAFVIRGVASNLAFQSALTRRPEFLSGDFDTGLIADAYPEGFHPSSLAHEDPLLLAAVAAYARRRYIKRATSTSGQLPGHSRRVDIDWVVIMTDGPCKLAVSLEDQGCEILYEGKVHHLRTNWKLGDLLLKGTWDGNPVCVQIERVGLSYRITHQGTQVDAMVMTARAAELLSVMPQKTPPDLSRLLLSPMPGLLVEVAATPGRAVRAGETLAVVEAMKMQNVLKADHDAVVAEVFASPGDNLAVDQPILRFE
ncbi:acetyl/propionyl/methylcrotonyl-CoA carboxylase subunit alpha [Planctomyces sp. SH-PL62]|uniref:acetyl-CoA carboxylase biotin carboxylase subunit n=1 Tax=Planctomyces sp. SH-PL62 TaxID=1636152 RepID=UPI00078C4B5D|nr:acetyl/propionyl/methylcrotonyl-CoA carboxylase subunit alpha [Planctomyces sp. SH-PL62]AMV39107.1 Biotin carboxylase [Planctomyces sp. SH-PL62]